mmetsp:Transcript_7152/g.14505  ORF Transcript_7152/g.14505 Transcript_7152/m.14505 type:complete len:299 (-) Transcript_7152:145-1041(-)
MKKQPNKSGVNINSYWWPAVGARTVVLLIHGHGSYLPFDYLHMVEPGKPKEYEASWVERFNQAGFSVCGIDFQGSGRSDCLDGLLSHFNYFQDLVDDVISLGVSIKDGDIEHFSGLPIYLCGISMGGAVTTHAAHQRGDLFAGAILLAPMLSLEKISRNTVNRILKPVSSLLNFLIPRAPIVKVERNEAFPIVQEDLDKDPLAYHGWTRVRSACEYLQATEKTVQEMTEMKFPFMVFHSKHDTMTDPEGSQMLYERSSASDKTLCMLDSMWHGLTREVGNENVNRKIIDWLEQRLQKT